MKATKIFYKRLINLGNYEHEEIGIELEVEEGEKALDVLEKAKQFVYKNHPDSDRELRDKQRELELEENIADSPDNYTFSRVTRAQSRIYSLKKELQELIDKRTYELPF